MTPPPPATLPNTVAWLGYGGLFPCVALALVSLLDRSQILPWREALLAYGAVILSFVGALHWSFGMTLPDLSPRQRHLCFAWSVAPALLAWVTLLIPPTEASALLVVGFLMHYWQDRRLVSLARLPAWYLPLRLRLTSVACLSLLMGSVVI